MSKPAYAEDALGLTEQEQIEARNLERACGTPSADRLIQSLRKHGQDQAVLEAALSLPLAEYRRVEKAYKAAEPVEYKRPRRRRS